MHTDRPVTSVDFNADMGESFGLYRYGADEELLPLLSSANVACGFHGGDPSVMRRTVALARQHSIAVGAHFGFPDLLGFGRRRLQASAAQVKDYVTYQIGALQAFDQQMPHGMIAKVRGDQSHSQACSRRARTGRCGKAF